LSSDKNEFAIKFRQSDLSLTKIEDLVYQRDCTKSLVEKTFESLQSMTDKLVNLEKELRSSLNSRHEESNEGNISDSQKLKDLLTLQLENSENFRLNTERTLNRIKEEFQQMVLVRRISLNFD
jgi:cell division FtsZ-interacting protein ZapD